MPFGSGPYIRAFMSTILADDLRDGVSGKRTFKAAIVERVEDIEAGYDLVLLASEIGCSFKSVEHYVRELQINRPKKVKPARVSKPRPRKLPSIPELIADIRSGVRPTHIAEAAGAKPPSVYRALADHGFCIRKKSVLVAPFIGTTEATNKRIAAVESIERQVEEILENRKQS